MPAKPHTHRAIPKLSTTVGWSCCIAHGPCTGSAHGAVVHVDHCRCGATRKIETNGRHKVSSGWSETE